jgi:REP element-mobilizing transposase RayT
VRKNKQQITVWNPKAAGRPKVLTNKERDQKIWHRSRPKIPSGKPVHVTLKTDKLKVPSLRDKKIYREIRQSLKQARQIGIRIIEFTVQKDHIHLLLEACDQKQLGESMRVLSISLSKRLSFILKRKIKAFKNRYHLHILNSLKEIKNARNYILTNGQKHLVSEERDYFSSNLAVNDFAQTIMFLNFWQDLQAIIDRPRFWTTRKVYKNY